jgi:hypothetical protein
MTTLRARKSMHDTKYTIGGTKLTDPIIQKSVTRTNNVVLLAARY